MSETIAEKLAGMIRDLGLNISNIGSRAAISECALFVERELPKMLEASEAQVAALTQERDAARDAFHTLNARHEHLADEKRQLVAYIEECKAVLRNAGIADGYGLAYMALDAGTKITAMRKDARVLVEALAAIVKDHHASSDYGYIEGGEVECVPCGNRAGYREAIEHDEDCMQLAHDLAEAALETPLAKSVMEEKGS